MSSLAAIIRPLFDFQVRHGTLQQSDGAPLEFLSDDVGLSAGIMREDAGIFSYIISSGKTSNMCFSCLFI